ncbi:hypothetical protein [Xanthomonas pisi]|uniref:Uncharacterized protein n=1 Tax=Xanthomonas pisi TaxID=56457 RepID=A0A2S7D0Y8_9XANT|nr:hypothetical protein [Xanthomonas pisi]KLD72600.1 hypothetical protein Y887_00060 [Xanthomonas pisi DSM 18956]PPU67487.1 hypothetical protein XpiCFBP4643_14690 [Xanthomonas pisi]
MLVLAILLAAAAPAATQEYQGKAAFEALADQADRRCPARRIRSITPGDLDFAQEEFQAQLTQLDRTRLNAANTADARCADQNGLACQANATLAAMHKTHLLTRFSAYLCAHPAREH